MPWFPRWRRRKDDTLADAARSFPLMGRRHDAADVPYVLPNDFTEINRLDFQHYMLRSVLRSNVIAPIHAPQEILDIGAGTGRWAMEVAAQFPHANVIATDVNVPVADQASTMGNGLHRRPDNYLFVPGNVLERLPFADNSFDYVHMRLLFLAIPQDKWPAVVREAIRVARPGEWIELVETLVTTPDNPGLSPATAHMIGWIHQLLRMRGINPLAGQNIATYLAQAGVPYVQTRLVEIPVGPHGGRVGKMMATDLVSVMEGLRGPITLLKMATPDEYERLMAQIRADMEGDRGAKQPFFYAYGQKGR